MFFIRIFCISDRTLQILCSKSYYILNCFSTIFMMRIASGFPFLLYFFFAIYNNISFDYYFYQFYYVLSLLLFDFIIIYFVIIFFHSPLFLFLGFFRTEFGPPRPGGDAY